MKNFTFNSHIFIQTFKTPDDLIEWIFIWNGITYYSKAFDELIVKQFCLN